VLVLDEHKIYSNTHTRSACTHTDTHIHTRSVDQCLYWMNIKSAAIHTRGAHAHTHVHTRTHTHTNTHTHTYTHARSTHLQVWWEGGVDGQHHKLWHCLPRTGHLINTKSMLKAHSFLTHLQVWRKGGIDGQHHKLWHCLPRTSHLLQPLCQRKASGLDLFLTCGSTQHTQVHTRV